FVSIGSLIALRERAITGVRGRLIAAGASLVPFAAAAFLIMGFARRSECMTELDAGKFRVSTGIVHGIQRGGRSTGSYAFLLDGERIVFGDAIVGTCGIAPPVGSRYAPTEGDRLRIEHDGNRIFRVLLDSAR